MTSGQGRQKSAVVIGAGVAGLASAILLGMNGWRVQVFDRQPRPGGLLARYQRKGVRYETGFHYCGGVLQDQILGRCLAHLGVLDQLEFVPLNPDGFDRVIFDDFEFRVPVGVDRYRQRLKDSFPHEAAGIDAFVDELEHAVSDYGIYSLKSKADPDRIVRWETMSLWSVLERHIRDPRLRFVLAGQGTLYAVPPIEAPFGLHAVVLSHFLEGAYRVRGGGDALANAMVRRVEALGGSVVQRARVTRVLTDGPAAVGVELRNRGDVLADLVVSSLHPSLLLDMLPEGSVRKAYRSRVRGQRLGGGHLGVAIELDAPIQSLDNANIYRMRCENPHQVYEDITPERVPFYFAAAPAPSVRKDGGIAHTMTMLACLGWDNVARWADSQPGRRPQDYIDYKQRMQDALIGHLQHDFPEIRGKIKSAHASTPLSTEFFTGSPKGAMYGHFHSTSQMGPYRLPQFIRVRDLIQVGQGVFTPGVLGATLSAYYGVGRMLGMPRMVSELQAVTG